MILPALDRGGYRYKRQVVIGKRLGGHDHKVDVLVSGEPGVEIPVSLKWQQTSGTAEQKVPFEVLCLAEGVQKSRGRFKKAYLVLGGGGWTLRGYYVTGDIRHYLRNCESVEIVSLETFVAEANQGKL
jgi:PD-(D/E)XK nuclease superfamily protein